MSSLYGCTRRQALGSIGALSVGVVSACFIASCGEHAKQKSQDDISTPTLVQLSLADNTVYAGEIVAKLNRYYHLMGLGAVKLAPVTNLSPSQAPISQLINDTVSICLTDPYEVAVANDAGADLRIVAIVYQKNPLGLLVKQRSHITSPRDLYRRTIGVQPAYDRIFQRFLHINKISPTRVHQVVVDGNLDRLAARRIDGILCSATEYSSLLEKHKIETHFMHFSDYGFAPMGQCVVVRNSAIDTDYERFARFLAAEIQGWKVALQDCDHTVKLLQKYGSAQEDINYDDQKYQLQRQSDYINTDSTNTNGLLTISPDIASQAVDRINATGPMCTQRNLFNNSLIKDVYQMHPELLK